MSNRRITATFDKLRSEGRQALIPFVTAGYPFAAITPGLMHGMVEAGVDIIELGVPFSDPMADGPVIQRASERALLKGVSTADVLAMVRAFRQDDASTPVVLMGYANPIEAMGAEPFTRAAAEAGVDGVLVVDYPPEECRGFAQTCRAAGLDPVFLLAPTSTEQRYDDVAAVGSGYIYYVSLKGVTGSATLDLDEVAQRIPLIREKVGMPVGVGFGIRDGATAARIACLADAVVIGSRIIEEIEQSSREDAPAKVTAFLRGIREAMDNAGAPQA